MKKVIIFILIIFISGLLIAIGLFVEGRDKQTELDKVNVRLRYNYMVQFSETYHEEWVHQARFAGFYTADKKGFYKENGINVFLSTEFPDFSVLRRLGNKDVFFITPVDQVLGVRDKGSTLVILAVLFEKSPFVLATINPEIRTPHDLLGKRIGIKIPSNSSNSEIILYRFLKKNNIDLNNITFIPVGFNIDTLLDGQVDAYWAYVLDEGVKLKETGRDVYFINPSDYGYTFYGDAIVAREEIIRENPDLVRRFLNASLNGWEYAYNHPSEALDYTMEFASDRQHQAILLNETLSLFNPGSLRNINPEILLETQDILLQKGFIDGKQFPIDVHSSYTTKFLEEIK